MRKAVRALSLAGFPFLLSFSSPLPLRFVLSQVHMESKSPLGIGLQSHTHIHTQASPEPLLSLKPIYKPKRSQS